MVFEIAHFNDLIAKAAEGQGARRHGREEVCSSQDPPAPQDHTLAESENTM